MARRWWKWLVLASIIPPLIYAYDRARIVVWVGEADLDVMFEIVDVDSQKPIGGAVIDVEAEAGGFCRDDQEQRFRLVCDQSGVARRECRQCMCFGRTSNLRFTDTFGIHAPNWRFRVSADGFETSNWEEVENGQRQGRRVESGRAKLVVRVELEPANGKK